MRTVEVTIAGASYAMPVNFAAAEQVCERAGDPFKLAVGLTRGEMLTISQLVSVLAIGARAAGCKLERAEIGEAIMEAGAQDFLTVGSKYVIALVSGQPELPATTKKKPE